MRLSPILCQQSFDPDVEPKLHGTLGCPPENWMMIDFSLVIRPIMSSSSRITGHSWLIPIGAPVAEKRGSRHPGSTAILTTDFYRNNQTITNTAIQRGTENRAARRGSGSDVAH